MKKLYVATNKALAIVRQRSGEWVADLQLTGLATQCLAVDPHWPDNFQMGRVHALVVVEE